MWYDKHKRKVKNKEYVTFIKYGPWSGSKLRWSYVIELNCMLLSKSKKINNPFKKICIMWFNILAIRNVVTKTFKITWLLDLMHDVLYILLIFDVAYCISYILNGQINLEHDSQKPTHPSMNTTLRTL